MVAMAAVGIAGYFILRRLFVHAAEGMARHTAQALDQLVRVATSTRTGQAAAAAIAASLASGRLTHFAAYAAAEHIPEEVAREQFAQSIERVARRMDSAIKLPIIGGVGLDAVLGLFPFAGDAVSTAVSLSLVAKSIRYGLPRELITKMLANVLVDFLMGAVPFVGDLADMWFKANMRNVALLRAYLDQKVVEPRDYSL